MNELHTSIGVAILSLQRASAEARRMRDSLLDEVEDANGADKLWNSLNDAADYLNNRAWQLAAYGKRLEKKGI